MLNVDRFEVLRSGAPKLIPFLLELLFGLGHRNYHLVEFVAWLQISLALIGDLGMRPLVEGGAAIDEGFIHDVLVAEHGELLRAWDVAELKLHVSLSLLVAHLLDVDFVAIVDLLRLRILAVVSGLLRTDGLVSLPLLETSEEMLHVVLAIGDLRGSDLRGLDDVLTHLWCVGLESLNSGSSQRVKVVVAHVLILSVSLFLSRVEFTTIRLNTG